MKLSKNRLNKIKLKRNASRKKYKLRTQRGKYENSKKRYKRDTHLNRKTLKVYVGGERVLEVEENRKICLLYTSPSPRDVEESRMPSSA